jgi:hypothetical protein
LIWLAAAAAMSFSALVPEHQAPERSSQHSCLRRMTKNVPPGGNENRAAGVIVFGGQGRHLMDAIGRRRWAIPEGYIPSESSYSDRALVSHETACILNAADRDAHVALTIFFADRDPVGPYRVTVAARRTLHLRFNDLDNPQPIPRDTDYASVFESDVPIIVQHTRLDSRRAEVALLSTVAYSEV